jgi:hypothetical protein
VELSWGDFWGLDFPLQPVSVNVKANTKHREASQMREKPAGCKPGAIIAKPTKVGCKFLARAGGLGLYSRTLLGCRVKMFVQSWDTFKQENLTFLFPKKLSS